VLVPVWEQVVRVLVLELVCESLEVGDEVCDPDTGEQEIVAV